VAPLGWAALLALPVGAYAWASAAEPIATFPVSFAVASEDGAPVADSAWIDTELEVAEAMFGERGVHFQAAPAPALDARFAHVETRDDRDALGSATQPHVINVFFVASLRDVDEPWRPRRGVHWHVRAHPETHFVIVASSASPTVLAHELGHYFGNAHSQVVDNLMSYERSGGPVFLDDAQTVRIRARAREYLRSGELLPAR
jgi:hypothetical protein